MDEPGALPHPDERATASPSSSSGAAPPASRSKHASPLSSPLAWMLAALLLAELIAGALPSGTCGEPDEPTASTWRNEANLRRWPEYTADVPPDADPLVVLISNSQGVGRELLAPQVGYPALLDAQLAAARPGARLLNWSCQGLRTSELEVLCLQAADRGADLIVLAVAYKTFEHPHLVRLGYGSSDVDLIAGRPSLWRALRRDTLTGELTTWDDLLARGLQLGTHLGRSRQPVLDALLADLSPVLRRALSGHAVPDIRPLGVDAAGLPLRPLVGRRREQVARAQRAAAARELGGLDSEQLLPPLGVCRAVIERLAARTRAGGPAVLWVWEPMDLSVVPAHIAPLLAAFQSRADQTLEAAGVPHLDLLDATPAEEFLTATHVDAAGHRRLARRLLPAVLDALP